MNSNDYLEKRRKKIEFMSRLYLGIQKLCQKPLYSIVIIALVVTFGIVWSRRNSLFEFVFLPSILITVLNHVVFVCLVLILILFVLIYIKYLGYLTAKKDEAHISLVFEEQERSKGLPILISKKEVKKGDSVVTVREFYSTIPMEHWEKKREAIADLLDISLVHPYIERGGRNRNKGKRIVLYSVDGRVPKERGVLYDESL